MSQRENALTVARQHHEEDYVNSHLLEVERIALAHSYLLADYDEDAISVIALLHDSIEDADVTYRMVKEEFGDFVAEMVWRLSDEPGKNRKERKAKTYPKIRRHEVAVFIKLCDRLHNVMRPELRPMYKKEHKDFREALYLNGEFEDLWQEIERYF